MDWDKYKSFSNNPNWEVNFWNIINNKDMNEYKGYLHDNVVADVTDSYKELSSKRSEE